MFYINNNHQEHEKKYTCTQRRNGVFFLSCVQIFFCADDFPQSRKCQQQKQRRFDAPQGKDTADEKQKGRAEFQLFHKKYLQSNFL